MSRLGFCSTENFKRLEDFPEYTSVIRCFGKPIIPPLITPQEKDEIAKLRSSLLQQKKQFVTTAKKDFENCEKSCRTNNEQLFYEKNIDCVQCQDCSTCRVSALNSSNLRKFSGSHLGNEMLVSMSKIPSSGICSTVHTNVIVCPNVAKQRYCESCDTEPGDSNSEFCDYYYESDCNYQSCQRNCGDNDVPYRNVLAKQTQNVSEDEQGSIADETEFGSLPTVIYNKKVFVQDTDSESIVTCMTQSTDLDKYMDCSIEFSSPDDLIMNSQSRLSNEMSISSRSQDVSSETIVNTENELTPCASAMAELNDFTEECNKPTEVSINTFSRDLTNISAHNRAYSVDSYMKVLRASARNLYLKKSQSEPSQQDMKGLENSVISTETIGIKDFKDDSEFVPSFLESVNVSSYTRLPTTFSDDFNSSIETKSNEKLAQRHVRRNSYTLSQPSLALIMAHADCNCQGESSIETSPHSCSSGHENIVPNMAFKKETLNYVLPPTLDREKKFPILSLEQSSNDSINNDLVSDSETIDSLVNVTDEENNDYNDESSRYSSMSDKITKSDVDKVSEKVFPCNERSEVLGGNSETEINYKNELCEELPNSSQLKHGDFKQTDKGESLNGLFEELRKNHQSRVNQLVEEQNKQWLKLQEEFKEQERKLFEKLKSFGISMASGDVNVNYPASVSNTNNESTIGSQITSHTIDSSQYQLTSSDSNSTNLSSETEMPTIIQNDLDKTNKSSEDKQQKAEYENPKQMEYIHSEKPEQFDSITNTHLNKNKNANHSHDIEQLHEKETIENNQMLLFSNNECISYKELERQEPNFHIPLQNVSNANNLISSNIFLKDESDHCNGPLQDSVDISLQTQGITPTGKLHSKALPPKNNNDLIRVIGNTSKNVVTDQSESKSCKLNKENDCTRNIFVNQVSTSNRIIGEKNILTQALPVFNSNFGDNIRKTCESGICLNSNIEQFTAETQSCNLNLGQININSYLPIVTNQEVILNSHPIPQKSAEICIQAKAMKLVPASSLTNLKRKKNKDLNDPDLLKRFEKLPAYVKGYLTRRLLKTERVQGLLKTIQETATLIQNLSKELKLKGNSISERDKEFHNQLFAQLYGNYEEIYDIICNVSTKEKMKIITESRNYRLRKKKAEKSQESLNVVTVADKPISVPIEKPKLSSATIKSLQRKKRSLVDSRTYTVEDLKQSRSRSIVDSRTYTVEDMKPCRQRAHSASNKKSHSTSPSRIYQTSVGVNLSRKTKSLIKPSQTQHWK